MRLWVVCVVFGFLGQAAVAEAPATSIRPMPRSVGMAAAPAPAKPADLAAAPAPTTAPTPATVPRPKRRPDLPALRESAAALPAAAKSAASVRPKHRPDGLAPRLASAQVMPEPALTPSPTLAPNLAPSPAKKKEKPSKKGSVCGDPAIKGEALAPIKGKVTGCGLDAPVRVTSVSGIRLSQPATISCDTAAAFKTWIEKGLRPAMGRAEVVEIRIAASYICRPRNNKKGAKISEHGRGKALDVAGFVFADGTQWSVAKNYNKQIRKAHKAACGIFGTTLGPGSDGYHEDHLHFDIARYRSGSYCK